MWIRRIKQFGVNTRHWKQSWLRVSGGSGSPYLCYRTRTEQQRQIRNEDLQIELEYFSEDYDEEREMEPRPEPRTKATLTLRLRSPGVRRQRERVVRFEDAPNREGNRRGRNAEGTRISNPLLGRLLLYKEGGTSKWDRFSPYRGSNHGLLLSLLKSPKEILATEKATRSFEPPPKIFRSKRTRDMSKYCYFQEDYGHGYQ
ncbi:hypothetical protein Tco_1244916 [Tanacetum coccineum]